MLLAAIEGLPRRQSAAKIYAPRLLIRQSTARPFF
jgi:hypothetical protein